MSFEQHQAAVIAAGAHGFWPLTSNYNDVSGGGRHLSLASGSGSSPTWVAGPWPGTNALQVGTRDVMWWDGPASGPYPADRGLWVNSSMFSLGFWVRAATSQNIGSVSMHGPGGAFATWAAWYVFSDRTPPEVGIAWGNTHDRALTYQWPTQEWRHVIITVLNDRLSVYVNGVLDWSWTVPAKNLWYNVLQISNWGMGPSPAVTALALFNRPLTPLECARIFAAGQGQQFAIRVSDSSPAPPLTDQAAYSISVAPRPKMVSNLYMEMDDGQSIDLDGTPLLHITEVDYGFPEFREVVDHRPQADGSIDNTQFFGSRVVTITGKIAIDWPQHMGGVADRGGRQRVMDALSPFMLPTSRPWLYSKFDDGNVRRIRLRPDQLSRPQIANVQDISFSFKAPFGVFEGDHDDEATINPGTSRIVINEGTMPSYWVGRIWGPCRAPIITNLTAGTEISLPGLQLSANQFVEIDVREHSVYLSGNPLFPRWSTVDFAYTTWDPLPPGSTQMRFLATQPGSGARFEMKWRDTFLE